MRFDMHVSKKLIVVGVGVEDTQGTVTASPEE
jgi:hypothetical protein